MLNHYLRRRQPLHLRAFARDLLLPLIALGANEAAAIVDGATNDQPKFAELAAGRSAPIAQAQTALGADYAPAAARGAALTDDELVAYLDDTITKLEMTTPEATGQPKNDGHPHPTPPATFTSHRTGHLAGGTRSSRTAPPGSRPDRRDATRVRHVGSRCGGHGVRRDAVAASSDLVAMLSLVKMWWTWLLTVLISMNIRSAIWGLVRPSVTWATMSCSVGVRLSQPWVGRRRSPHAFVGRRRRPLAR